LKRITAKEKPPKRPPGNMTEKKKKRDRVYTSRPPRKKQLFGGKPTQKNDKWPIFVWGQKGRTNRGGGN